MPDKPPLDPTTAAIVAKKVLNDITHGNADKKDAQRLAASAELWRAPTPSARGKA